MKSFIIHLAMLAIAIPAVQGEVAWTSRAEVGEDATSTYYCFYQSAGASVRRVRSVWNGGAQNPPTVTEFVFEPGGIRIRHLVGTRAHVEGLVMGKDFDDLKLETEYFIRNSSSKVILRPPPPDTHLTDGQRRDLSHLIQLLALDRKPIKQGEEQTGTGRAPTHPVPKSEKRSR